MDPAFSCEFCGVYMGDDDKEPRVLCCGHTFCTPCVCDFFRGGKYKCPSCSRQHHPENTDAIPVNHSLLKMIKAEKSPRDKKCERSVSSPGLSEKDGTTMSDPETNLPTVNPGSSEEPLHHAGKCDKHDAYCTFWCKKCKEWICHDCTVISHPPAQCDIRSFSQAVEEMKVEEDLCIKRTVEVFDTHAEKYHEKQWALKALREKHRALIKELQGLLSKHQKAKRGIERQAEAIKSCLADGLTTLLTLLESQGRLLEAQTLEEVLDARHQAQKCQSKILAWHDPAILAESEEVYYSEELQNSTSTALAVLRHTLPPSDNSSIKSPSSDFTTLSTEDEAEVARNIKCLMESPEWKRIVEKRENDDLATDNSWWHCLAKGSGKTDTRKDELDKGLFNSQNKTSDQQLEVKSPSPRKRHIPVERCTGSCQEDTDNDCRCYLPHKQQTAHDDLKGLVYPPRSTHPVAKRRASLSPKLDQITENEELVEGLPKEPEKCVEGKGLDHPQLPTRRRIGFTEDNSNQIVSGEGLQKANVAIPSTHGGTCTETNTKTPETSLPAVGEAEPTFPPEQEGSSRENSLLEDSRNELHLFYYANGGFENAPETDFGSNESGTNMGCDSFGKPASAGNDSAGNSASAGNNVGNPASAGSGSVGNPASPESDSVGNSALARNESDGNTASGSVIVVSGEADEDDDNENGTHYYDNDYFDHDDVFDGGYERDAILSSVSGERENGTEQTERKRPSKKHKKPHGSGESSTSVDKGNISYSNGSTTSSGDDDVEGDEGSSDDDEDNFVREGETFGSGDTEPRFNWLNYEPPGHSCFHRRVVEGSLKVGSEYFSEDYGFTPGSLFLEEFDTTSSSTDSAEEATLDCTGVGESQTEEVASGSAENEKMNTTADVREIEGNIQCTDTNGKETVVIDSENIEKIEIQTGYADERHISQPYRDTDGEITGTDCLDTRDDTSRQNQLGELSTSDGKEEATEEGRVMLQSHKADSQVDFSIKNTQVTPKDRELGNPSATDCKGEEAEGGIIMPQSETEAVREILPSGHIEDAKDSSMKQEQNELETADCALEDNEEKVNKDTANNKSRISDRCRVT